MSNVEFIEHIKKYKDSLGGLGRVYGAQWRAFKNLKLNDELFDDEYPDVYEIDYIDQISNLIKGLRETPMGTKHIVTAWNPSELNDMALPPCHWSFEILVEPIKYFKGFVEEGEAEYQFTLKWHQRSVDTFLGLPFNIASYGLLAQIIGKLTNMVPKGIIGDLSNVHIYEPHLDAVKKQLSRSTNMHNSKCKLEEFGGFKMDMRNDFDQWLSSKDIKDFKLTKHNEQLAIPAEMLPYNK
jgi:thymidylate synthase